MNDVIISLCMIVRNEAANLEQCLLAAKNQVDEIIIVDTGSVDDTLDIASKFTSQIYKFKWEGDFGAARNFALSKAKGEWILYLDADEFLCADNHNLHELVNANQETEAYFLSLVNYVEDNQSLSNTFLVLRLFKNNGNYKFRGKIHEQIIVTDPAKVRITEKPIIYHRPSSKKERNHKRMRNLTLLKQAIIDEPDNPFLYYYLGVEWLMLNKPAKALPYFKYAYENIPTESSFFVGPTIKYLSLCYKFTGQMDEALIICMEGVNQLPEYTDLLFLAGCILEEQQEWSIAIKWFQEAITHGQSHAVYSRLEGAGSFVAYYHLGYCQAKLRLYQEAVKSWENALKINLQYFYPLLNLFLVLIEAKGPEQTLLYFKNNFDLVNVATISLLADLFFKSGYPNWAVKFIDLCKNEVIDEEILLRKAKYILFSGQPESCLKLAEKLAQQDKLAFYCGLAKFLLNDPDGMKKEIIILWKEHSTRPKARLLLALKNAPHSFLVKDDTVITETVNTLIECMRFLSSPNMPQVISNRMNILIDYLKEIIVQGGEKHTLALYDLSQEFIFEMQNLLDVIYPGGLGVSVYEQH